jgi:hypothetical protein
MLEVARLSAGGVRFDEKAEKRGTEIQADSVRP